MPTINFVRCLLLLLVISLVDCSIGERVNSSGGMVWSTARDEAELVEDSGVVIGEQDQIDDLVFSCGDLEFRIEGINMNEEEVEVWDQSSRGCSHTHSCNPPGPEDASHSHTCFHTHTHLIIPDPLENDHFDSDNKKRSCGNREAVRKYREKKKARTAYLEDEVKRLQSLNEHLLRKLQSQAMVETELVRLRTLLVEMQVKIDGELGGLGLSFQTQCNSSAFVFKEDGCTVPTRNVTCEAATVECEEAQPLHDAIHSFVPHSPPF